MFISAAHQVQPTPPSPRRKGHVLDWELVRARARGAAGQEGVVFVDDQWALLGQTHMAPAADSTTGEHRMTRR